MSLKCQIDLFLTKPLVCTTMPWWLKMNCIKTKVQSIDKLFINIIQDAKSIMTWFILLYIYNIVLWMCVCMYVFVYVCVCACLCVNPYFSHFLTENVKKINIWYYQCTRPWKIIVFNYIYIFFHHWFLSCNRKYGGFILIWKKETKFGKNYQNWVSKIIYCFVF